jgi:hypothetical protein
MRIPAELTDSDLRHAHEAAGVVASDKYRPCLPGRLLPMLVPRFRDDAAQALQVDLPSLPERPPAGAAKAGELTSSEFAILWDAVDALAGRFAPCMDGPELPRLLAGFRRELLAERAERARIAAEFAVRARAS